jgi:DegV family protein with EDD domain
MKLGLVTDSTSDLPADLAADRGIAVVPAVLVIDGRSYVDGRGISREAFYNRLPGMTTLPTTASPSIGEFVETYRRLLGEGCDHVLSVHAAGKLTTIADVAQMAAADLDGRITVLESGSLSLGLGFQMLAAADAADQGLGLEAALAAVRSVRGRTRVVAALDTMEYLRRSGRVPATVAALGGLLSIKPVVELSEGDVEPLGAVRTTRQANKRMRDLLLGLGALERLAVLHTNAEGRARWLLDEVIRAGGSQVPREILMVNVTTVIGTHVGPYGLGFAAVTQ